MGLQGNLPNVPMATLPLVRSLDTLSSEREVHEAKETEVLKRRIGRCCEKSLLCPKKYYEKKNVAILVHPLFILFYFLSEKCKT